MIKKSQIRSVQEFIKEVSKISYDKDEVVFYRGHANAKAYSLQPSIYRDQGHRENESVMYNELYASNPGDFLTDRTTFDRLVRMQHYGLPSRLLDITSNPLMALFFACQVDKGGSEKKDAANDKEADGEIIPFVIEKKHVKYFDSDTVSCVANLARLSQCQRLAIRDATFAFDRAMTWISDNDYGKITALFQGVSKPEVWRDPIIGLLRECEGMFAAPNICACNEVFQKIHRLCSGLLSFIAEQRNDLVSMMVGCKTFQKWTEKQRIAVANVIGKYGLLRKEGADTEQDERIREECRRWTRFKDRQLDLIVAYTDKYCQALKAHGSISDCHCALTEFLVYYMGNLNNFKNETHKGLKTLLTRHCEFLAACDDDTRAVINEAVSKIIACLHAEARKLRNDFNETWEVAQLHHFVRDEKPHFLPCIVPQDLDRILCVRPKMANSRIMAQSGAFLLFGLTDTLEKDVEGISIAPRIVIPHNVKAKIIEDLRKLNIDLSTVYPQIDNAAKMIAKNYVTKDQLPGA